MRFLGFALLCAAVPCFAGEFAVLASGGRLHADRHETDAGRVRLYTGAGYVELDAAQVRTFEPEESAPVLPPKPAAASPAPAAVQPAASPFALADAAADKYGLPRRLVRSVMSAESAGQAQAVSPKGALGLMQLMPSTAKELGVDPLDPVQNVDAGTRYLRDLLVKYNFGLWHALAAYNAGPGTVDKYNGVPPYRDTVNYIRRIDRDYRGE